MHDPFKAKGKPETKELIARLMAAIETPADLTEEEVRHVLEDAHIALTEEDE